MFMQIMQEDMLSELHLPKSVLANPQNVLPQKSTRFDYLLRENDYINNSKAIPVHFKGTTEPVVSGFAELDLLSLPGEHSKPAKRKFICKKSLLRKNNYLINGTRKPLLSSALREESHTRDEIQGSELTRGERISQFICSNEGSNKQSLTCSENLDLNALDTLPRAKAAVQSVQDEFSKCSENVSREVCSDKKVSPDVEVFVPPSDKTCDAESENRSEPALCVISEVIGNANETFSRADDPQENPRETPEVQLITPKKTTDITKIKGWRRKQFFVEKPTTVEYYSITVGSDEQKRIEIIDGCPVEPKEPENTENAFVCDSLDEFLDREADLKIGYEIPHLYAEFGIKLTSDDIVSKPNLSEEDIKEVGTRYCVPVSLPCDGTNLDDIKEETFKRMKRPLEEDSKPRKVLKSEENRKQLIRCEQKSVEIEGGQNCFKPMNVKTSRSKSISSWSNVKLMSKLIALVVYPSPFVPLHPLVQYHIDKLRSYSTKVDRNWANFAVSAVLVDDKRCRRKILPVHCCVKVEKTPATTPSQDSRVNLVADSDTESKTERVKLKKCSVVVQRLDPQTLPDPWCMEHKCYNCAPCGLVRSVEHAPQAPSARKEAKNQSEEPVEAGVVSRWARIDKKVADLLAQKVRHLKYNGDTLTSIDCLKTLTPNTIEFIKLSHFKQSFITGCISIWFLNQNQATMRSRAFVTFSQTPPVPNAVRLSSATACQTNLPKVLTEIVSAENSLDSNEYAILHCNGQIWEIHGLLNIAFGKLDKKVEQIFSSLELPELTKLEKVSYDILKVKSVKWWILDLTQKFLFLELKSGNNKTVITRQRFLETITLKLFGYLPLRKGHEHRVLGAYIAQRLLPFILIGPYYLLETHNVVLRDRSSTVPFRYYGAKKVSTNHPLKFFINSVIKNVERSDRRLEGLWLYDKMFLDSTSYLEVTTTPRSQVPAGYSSIDIDHGYSLNSLTNSSFMGAASEIVRRKDGRKELMKVTVYLYFDIFELGFVEGELQSDNSVIISHPIMYRTKMRSHIVGNLFIGAIRTHIRFFPKDLEVRWYVTRHKKDLGCRQPFNALYLRGFHILTKSGIFNLLRVSESEIAGILDNDKDEMKEAVAECLAMKERAELKRLAALLSDKLERPIKKAAVLKEALSEIRVLGAQGVIFRRKKNKVMKRKLSLTSRLIKLINSSQMRFQKKLRNIEDLSCLFKEEGGGLTEEFIKKLNCTRIGRKYLAVKQKRDSATARRIRKIRQREREKMNKLKSQPQASEVVSEGKNPIPIAPTIKIFNEDLFKEWTSSEESKLPLEAKPDEGSSFKSNRPRILKPSNATKREKETNVAKANAQTDSAANTSEDDKLEKLSPEFFSLNFAGLPENIKLASWGNWNVSKLEVA